MPVPTNNLTNNDPLSLGKPNPKFADSAPAAVNNNNKQTNKQTFKVRQPQRAARSKRPNTPSDGSKHNGFQTTNQAVLIPKHVSRQDRAHDQEHHPLLLSLPCCSINIMSLVSPQQQCHKSLTSSPIHEMLWPYSRATCCDRLLLHHRKRRLTR